MFFVLTSLILILGIVLLRKKQIVAGYVTLAIGWIIAIIVTVLTNNQWDAGFSTFLIAILFMWFVQKKMGKSKKSTE